MNDIYSIGETAKINDISIKALRHYDEIGLLKPRYTDPNNGYRYYTYDQFSFLDKIKRFRSIGMSLKELKEIFNEKDIHRIEIFLSEQKKALEEETRLLAQKKENVKLLADFFDYSKSLEITGEIFTKYIDERKMIVVDCDGGDTMYAMDMELRRVFSLPELSNAQALNPYGYILDFDSLLENKFFPSASTVTVSVEGNIKSEYVKTIPAGQYLCFRAKALSDDFDASAFIEHCKKYMLRFDFVIACEYLKSIYDPANSPYEIQALISK